MPTLFNALSLLRRIRDKMYLLSSEQVFAQQRLLLELSDKQALHRKYSYQELWHLQFQLPYMRKYNNVMSQL